MSESDTEHSRRPYGSQATHPDDFRGQVAELQHFDADLVLGYYRRVEALLDACPIDIYAASSLKHPWPYRLQNAAECYPASFWRSQHRIYDSAIAHPGISNADVLSGSISKHGTAVIAKDYLPFDAYDEDELDGEDVRALENLRRVFTDHREATTASIKEFVQIHAPDRHPPAYIPIQPPYDDHLDDVYPIVEDSHLDHRYVLGGLKDASPARRIDQLLDFRSRVGDGSVAHGLGWGLGDELVRFLRDEPALLDSVDNSGPAQAIQNGKVLGRHWRSNDCPQVGGEYQNSIGGAYEFATLLSGAQRLTEYNNDYDDDVQQTGLSEFWGATADD